MNDACTHQEPTVQQPDKLCVVCAEPIKAAALKCIRCGGYQDWRRYSDYVQPWVPYLVAIISAVVLAFFTYMSQIMHTPDSMLELSSPNVFNDDARFIVANAGDRPGVVEQAYISMTLRDPSGKSYYFQSVHAIPPEQVDIIKPGEQRSYAIRLTDRPLSTEFDADFSGLLKLLRQTDAQMFERTGACRFSIDVRNFRSDRKHIDSPIRCYDISAYVNNYLINIDKKNIRLEDKGKQP
jgi:hypothetical protein